MPAPKIYQKQEHKEWNTQLFEEEKKKRWKLKNLRVPGSKHFLLT